MKDVNEQRNGEQADLLMDLVSTLSLFTRITMNQWLPALFSELSITEERYMALFELTLQPDCSLKQLAQNLMVSPSNLSVMIDSMVQQGLVSRVSDPNDRRRVVLRLSEKGTDVCRKADAYTRKQFERFLADLSGEDREELEKAANQMIRIARKIIEQKSANNR